MTSQRRQGTGYIGGDFSAKQSQANHSDAERDTARFLRVTRAIERRELREGTKVAPAPAPISIRPMCIDDAAYVLDSWSNSYRRSPTTGPIEREVFNIEQRARINRLVTRPHSRIFIACDAVQQRQIRGWVCFEAPQSDDGVPILHYVCVQPAFQMQGIGSALVELARATARDRSVPMWATHETQPMRHIREKWNLLYNPYLLEVPDRKAAAK